MLCGEGRAQNKGGGGRGGACIRCYSCRSSLHLLPLQMNDICECDVYRRFVEAQDDEWAGGGQGHGARGQAQAAAHTLPVLCRQAAAAAEQTDSSGTATAHIRA